MDSRRERGQEWAAGPPSAAGTGSDPPPSRPWIRRQLARRGAPLPPPTASLEEHLRYHERYAAAECGGAGRRPGPGPPPPLDAARILPLLSLFSGAELRELLLRFCDQHALLLRCCGHSPRRLRAELAHALAERVSRVSDAELSAATGAAPPLWHTRLFWQKVLVLRWLGIDGDAAPARHFLRSERREACAAPPAGPARSRSGDLTSRQAAQPPRAR
ncbi:hypothetical protein FJT64_024881 [Amphibalanus amphitrite]|uniref:Uncharacterized protein n=1 Tax=Amphibalanus amphitrite TaxID=1232801 RepID=A0A6A4W9A5_AMPAM|nr:hypothetical protein FJT64_024881 [Amphibalanus amphitrite]